MGNFIKYLLSVTLWLILPTSIGSAIAQENLSPDVGGLYEKGNYTANLRMVFKDGLADEVVLRVLVTTAFSGECMIGIKKNKNGYELFELNISDGFVGEDPISEESVNENVKRYRRDLPVNVVDDLAGIWQEALLGVRHEKPRIILDGSSFGFSMFVKGYGAISGHVVSPEKGSRTWRLVELVAGLDKFVKGSIDLRELDKYIAKIKADS